MKRCVVRPPVSIENASCMRCEDISLPAMCPLSRMKLGPGLSPFNRSEPRRLLKWFALCRPVVSTSETDHKGHPWADVPVMKYASGFAM